jgi:hypothetical protein
MKIENLKLPNQIVDILTPVLLALQLSDLQNKIGIYLNGFES